MKIPALLWEWPAAFLAHLLVGATVLLLQEFAPAPAPIFKPEDVLIVSMSGPPKSDSRMVQKAERAPEPLRGAATPTTEPPPNQTSDMAFKTPEAQVSKGQTDAELQRIMEDMKRAQLLKDLSAPVGTQDRAASDPNGVGDGSMATAGVNDPEVAKWQKKVDDKVKVNWHPIVSTCQANPKLKVAIGISIDGQGNMVEEPTIHTSSGNSSLDQSGLRAVQQTATMPPPPPRWASGLVFSVVFECRNVI